MTTASVATSGPAPAPGLAECVDYVLGKDTLPDVTPIAKLLLPSGSAEELRCREIIQILTDYAERKSPSVPLSIAVFGDPGSGKSYFVNQILAHLGNLYEAAIPVNLSQLSEPKDLTECFKEIATKSTNASKVGVLFIDEFDSSFNGMPMGWLRWFLSPMQDAKFFDADTKAAIEFKKALFIFAGGTAPSLDDFVARARLDLELYRHNKVPDFISRLRGFIDIPGINGDDPKRTVRRALVLRQQLDKRWPEQRAAGILNIDPKLIQSLLSNVHYTHGVRSMEALLDMSRLSAEGNVTASQLPTDKLKELHLSRGSLDLITVGISAGQDAAGAGPLLQELAAALLRNGATLAYGGDFVPNGALEALAAAAENEPPELVSSVRPRVRNYLGFPSHLRANPTPRAHLEILKLETLSLTECTELGVPAKAWFSARPTNGSEAYEWRKHLAWAISLFRMRLRMMQDITALVVVGGKAENSWGRFSGIAEEVVLAMTLGKPVYVLGGCEGSAQDIGLLLGLGKTVVNSEECLAHQRHIGPSREWRKVARLFQVPRHPEAPQNIPDIRAFLADRFVGTDGWPWNGLEITENRLLFEAPVKTPEGVQTAVELIKRGISRLSWKPMRASSN